MAESLESFKSYIGKSETATDVVTASAMLKFAATLGQENPPRSIFDDDIIVEAYRNSFQWAVLTLS
jgi:hypothetical protein